MRLLMPCRQPTSRARKLPERHGAFRSPGVTCHSGPLQGFRCGNFRSVMDTTLAFLAELRGELARRSVTQDAVAERLGVTRAAVSRKLRGLRPLTIAELREILDMLGIERGSLLSPGAPATLDDLLANAAGQGPAMGVPRVGAPVVPPVRARTPAPAVVPEGVLLDAANHLRAPSAVDRERRRFRVLDLLSEGMRQVDIAAEVGVSEGTVRADERWLREHGYLAARREAEHPTYPQAAGDGGVSAGGAA